MNWRGTCLNSGVNYARIALLGSASLACFFLGCTTAHKPAQSTASDGRLFAVTADSASFFHHGPRQGRSPDSTLPKDTLVKLIRPSFGYSKVQVVATGEQGYVSSEEIKPAASSMLVASVTTKPTDSATTTHPSAPPADQFNLNSSDPRLVPPPEDLPADLPAPAPGQ